MYESVLNHIITGVFTTIAAILPPVIAKRRGLKVLPGTWFLIVAFIFSVLAIVIAATAVRSGQDVALIHVRSSERQGKTGYLSVADSYFAVDTKESVAPQRAREELFRIEKQ